MTKTKTKHKGKHWRVCDPCGKSFIARIDRGQFYYCSERCEKVHAMWCPAGTYRICSSCDGIFLALDRSERKCSDCHRHPAIKPARVEEKGKRCARL
jgi:hypothetical protein